MPKHLPAIIAMCCAAALLTACSDADTASQNLSTAADNFQIARRIVFYNGITGGYMLTITGYCSLGNDDKAGELSVTCKVGPNAYKKDFLGLSDNVTYFAEQLDPANVSPDHYEVVFKPETIIPDLVVR
jgi:hypothetical protein